MLSQEHSKSEAELKRRRFLWKMTPAFEPDSVIALRNATKGVDLIDKVDIQAEKSIQMFKKK